MMLGIRLEKKLAARLEEIQVKATARTLDMEDIQQHLENSAVMIKAFRDCTFRIVLGDSRGGFSYVGTKVAIMFRKGTARTAEAIRRKAGSSYIEVEPTRDLTDTEKVLVKALGYRVVSAKEIRIDI